MRGMRLGLGFGRGRGNTAPFTVSITGRSTDSLGLYGQIGNHAAIGFTSDITPDSVKWSASADPAAAATFGTGANPTAFGSADGFLVYLHVTLGAETVTRSFPARYAPGAFAALSNQSFTKDSGNQTYTHAAATGANLTWAYAATGLVAGVTYDPATRTFTADTNALAVQSGTVITVRALDQYGRNPGDQTFTLTVEAAAPTGIGSMAIGSTFQVA